MAKFTVERGSEPGALVVTARGRFAKASVDVRPYPGGAGWSTSRGGRYFTVEAAVEAAERELGDFVRTLDDRMASVEDDGEDERQKAMRDVRRENEVLAFLAKRSAADEPTSVKPPKPVKPPVQLPKAWRRRQPPAVR